MAIKDIILEGKDLEKLIEEGLIKLDKQRDDVNIEIIEQGKSVMGIKISNYKVRLSINNTSQSINIDDNHVNVDNNTNNDFNFEIKYLEDGVYLSILVDAKISNETLEEILEKIERKKIKNYDLDIIGNIMNVKNNQLIKIAPEQNELLIDEDIIIEITKDGMEGYMEILPPEGGKILMSDEIYDKIDKLIKFGLDKNQFEGIIKNRIYNKKILIANGLLPTNGRAGHINYNFKMKKSLSPNVMKDGSVDYRDLNLIQNVNKGDILAILVLPTEGKPGYNVMGKVIPNKKGKDIKFKYGKNVIISENGMKLIADCSGQVVNKDGKITVSSVYEVEGNVDNSTGNINFNGSVVIKGNINTDFEILADGDVQVNGVVEGAVIKCSGDIFLKRGVQGRNKGKLEANGSIVAKYIENSNLFSNSDITAEVIMHSEVLSEGTIEANGKKGLIIGGICKAKKEVCAKTIGSEIETKTVIEVGLDPNLKSRYESLKIEVAQIKNNIEKLDKSIIILNKMAKAQNLTIEKKEMLIKFLETRKILEQKHNKSKLLLKELEAKIDILSKGKVKVSGVIYPGVKIIIGNDIMYIKEMKKNCTIYKENGEIRIGPYE